jgi:signal transduction histidine kinase
MVYLLTHDIRNFASQPISLANFIIEEENAALRNQYANLIIDSSNQQVVFLQAFITLLNQEDEILNSVISKSTINLKTVVKRLETELELKLKEKKITLLVNTEVEDVVLNINEILFTRLLFNLITNAIKFSNFGSEIKLIVNQSGGFLKIQVIDTGIGFDLSKKEVLFDKFTSMGRTGTNNEISTGIGLYLCNQIAKKFKGSIDAYSDGENKGATFTVAFQLL